MAYVAHIHDDEILQNQNIRPLTQNLYTNTQKTLPQPSPPLLSIENELLNIMLCFFWCFFFYILFFSFFFFC